MDLGELIMYLVLVIEGIIIAFMFLWLVDEIIIRVKSVKNDKEDKRNEEI